MITHTDGLDRHHGNHSADSIVKENAIMVVDFYIYAEHNEGNSRDSIFQGCMLRFRTGPMPIVVAMLGVQPLAVGRGMGSDCSLLWPSLSSPA